MVFFVYLPIMKNFFIAIISWFVIVIDRLFSILLINQSLPNIQELSKLTYYRQDLFNRYKNRVYYLIVGYTIYFFISTTINAINTIFL